MSETEIITIPEEIVAQLVVISHEFGRLNTGSTGKVLWLGTSDPPTDYEWSQEDFGVSRDGKLVACSQSGCSCSGPEEPTPEQSWDLDGPISIKTCSGYDGRNHTKEALEDLLGTIPTLYRVLQGADVSTQDIIGLPNAEIRRAVVEVVGYEKIVDGAEVLDESLIDGTLLRVPLEDDEDLVLVHVQDPSTDRQYFLRVPPNMKTAKQARAWTFGFDAKDFEPLVET